MLNKPHIRIKTSIYYDTSRGANTYAYYNNWISCLLVVLWTLVVTTFIVDGYLSLKMTVIFDHDYRVNSMIFLFDNLLRFALYRPLTEVSYPLQKWVLLISVLGFRYLLVFPYSILAWIDYLWNNVTVIFYIQFLETIKSTSETIKLFVCLISFPTSH